MDISEFSTPQLKEMQACLLNILLTIDKVCREHNLRYYIIAGTLLGAVRHKGFIPWDDDADVAMPREDYEKLIRHAREWLPERYELVSGTDNPRYPYLFARIQDRETTYVLRRRFDFVGGVPVDVFPLDGMTPSGLRRRVHYFKYGVAKKLLYHSLVDPYKHGKGLRCLFAKMMHKLVSPAWAHHTADRLQQEFSIGKTGLVADHDNKPSRGILPAEVYGEPRPIEFCGHMLMGVSNPDAYLRYCYGDYMAMPTKLPPQNFRTLDLHKSYK